MQLLYVIFTYYPFRIATDKTDNYYLVQILEHEYGQVIIGTLATSPQTCKAEAQKVARHDKRIGDVSAAQLASAAYDRDWPSVIPQNLVLFESVL